MKIKNKTKKIINKKNILTKRYFFNLFLLLTMIIATTGGMDYYFFNHFKKPVYEIILNKNNIFQTKNNDCFDDYNNKIKQLNKEITIKNEELKDSNLTPQEKTVIEEIVKLKSQQKNELETDLLLKKLNIIPPNFNTKYRFPCPIHQGQNPTCCHLTSDNKIHCWKCCKDYDIIDVYMEIRGIKTFNNALEKINNFMKTQEFKKLIQQKTSTPKYFLRTF